MLQDTHDILLTNYEDQEPVLRFDGVGGIVMSNVGSDRRTLLFINCNSLSRMVQLLAPARSSKIVLLPV